MMLMCAYISYEEKLNNIYDRKTMVFHENNTRLKHVPQQPNLILTATVSSTTIMQQHHERQSIF